MWNKKAPTPYQSKDMANVKVFADKQNDKRKDGHTERPKTIDVGA